MWDIIYHGPQSQAGYTGSMFDGQTHTNAVSYSLAPNSSDKSIFINLSICCSHLPQFQWQINKMKRLIHFRVTIRLDIHRNCKLCSSMSTIGHFRLFIQFHFSVKILTLSRLPFDSDRANAYETEFISTGLAYIKHSHIRYILIQMARKCLMECLECVKFVFIICTAKTNLSTFCVAF